MRRLVCLSLVAFSLGAHAQVLARKGWAGSGVAPETWWKRAVFLRIQPALFQDSDGDGTGDLHGIAQRLDYIGKLGVDAIVLQQPFNESDFSDLAIAASRSHLRVLVELTTADPARARFWLNQGAAGLVVDYPALGKDPAAALRDLRHATDSVPGERVLIGPPIYGRPTDTPQLVFAVAITSAPADTLRRELLPLRDSSMSPTTNPLIELRGLPTNTASPNGDAAEEIRNRTLAAMAFLSRGAVIFDAGRELGLTSANGRPTTMQWTPANITRATPPPAPPTPPKPKEEVYGAYVPYVPPPKLNMPAPVAPTVVAAENPPPVDPNTLPGFTSGTLPSTIATNGVTSNVALEDHDDASTLNFFRHLIALHHDIPAVRNGAQFVPDATTPAAFIWLRRAPAGTATSASIIIAANLGPTSATLDLGLTRAGIRAGSVRMLLTASAAHSTLSTPSASQLMLPAWTVFVGELQHNSSEPASHSRR